MAGAAGYLGSIICEHLLDSEHQVTAIDNLMYGQNCLYWRGKQLELLPP
ncbi:NAD-dependent epimerase/dehydratase family protein [Roseofilum reptotaenium]